MGGSGVGGKGATTRNGTDANAAYSGTANTGSGGGGGLSCNGTNNAGSGGSGIVIISYENSQPSAPTDVSATPGPGELYVNWNNPANIGSQIITAYQVEYSTTGTSGWTIASSSIAPLERSHTITGLNLGAEYFIRVAGIYSGGLGAYGYPWTLIYKTITPNRNSANEIVYVDGFGLETTSASAVNADSNYSRIRYRIESTYGALARYVEADFYKTLGTKASGSQDFSLLNLQVPSLAPSASSFKIHANVNDLTVFSNDDSVQSGSSFSGRLENWPWNYNKTAVSGLSARSSNTFDDSDTPSGSDGYGSFQLHNLSSDTTQTVFAWNRHSYDAAENSYELGFGNSPSGNSDWTFCNSNSLCNDRSSFNLQIFINMPIQTVSSTITSATISFDAGNLMYRTPHNITAVASVPGKITFKINSKRIPGCVNKRANSANSLTVICEYKPSNRGFINISITLNPTNPAYSSAITQSARVFVGRRIGARQG